MTLILSKVKRQSKHKIILEDYIYSLKEILKNPQAIQNTFKIFDRDKEQIKYFESLPFGKELSKAFETMILRIGKHFPEVQRTKTIWLNSFMFNFYKTLIICIDKKLKQSKNIGVRELKNAVNKTGNTTELKKALGVFNCKTQNNLYEFSKNGVIELYTGYEYLNLKKTFQLRRKESELKNFKIDNVRNQLKTGDPNYELYREIVTKQISNGINEKHIPLTKIIKDISKRDKYPGDLYDTFDKWKTDNIDYAYENLVSEVISSFLPANSTYK